MSVCRACLAAAEDSTAGEYRSGCPGCEVRAIAQAPRFVRLAFYNRIADEHERSTFAAAVAVEHKRIAALRAAGARLEDGEEIPT